jgi:hypothetical protein
LILPAAGAGLYAFAASGSLTQPEDIIKLKQREEGSPHHQLRCTQDQFRTLN